MDMIAISPVKITFVQSYLSAPNIFMISPRVVAQSVQSFESNYRNSFMINVIGLAGGDLK